MRILNSAALLLALGSISVAQAGSNCRPVGGLIKLDPDASCQIATDYPANAYLRAPGTCYKTTMTGLGKGSSGLTSETAYGIDTGHTATPAAMNENGVAPAADAGALPYTRRFITGRSVLKTANGTLYTADAGVTGPRGNAEQIVITGGDNRYAGASGQVYVFGNYIGNWGAYAGEICTTSD